MAFACCDNVTDSHFKQQMAQSTWAVLPAVAITLWKGGASSSGTPLTLKREDWIAGTP